MSYYHLILFWLPGEVYLIRHHVQIGEPCDVAFFEGKGEVMLYPEVQKTRWILFSTEESHISKLCIVLDNIILIFAVQQVKTEVVCFII